MTRPVDAERLAALLDGRLSGAEREEVLAQLAASDDLAEVYADAVAALAEPAGVAAHEPRRETPVIPLRPPRPRAWLRRSAGWLAAAAAVALLVLSPWVRGRFVAPGASAPARYVALLEQPEGLPEGYELRPWGAARAAGEPLGPDARAVRVGARLAQLELAARGRDTSVAALARDVAALLGDVPGGGAAAAVYREVERRASEPAEGLAPLLAQGSAAASGVAGAQGVALGAWLEVARVAAQRRDAGFYGQGATASALVLAEQRAAQRTAARAPLARLRAALAGGAPRWDEASAALTELLAALAR